MTNKDQCREAFEEHVLAPNGFYENGAGWVARNADGTYRHENIQALWIAWQAARSAPAAPVELPEPAAWLIARSAFRVSPHGQDAESNEWLEEAHEPGEEGSFRVYTEQQVRELLSQAGTVVVETPESPPKSAETRMDASSDRGGEVLPAGWVAVPVEPTREMCEADWDISLSYAHTNHGVERCFWAAMLAAAPKLPQGDGWLPIESAPKNQLVMVYSPPQNDDHPEAIRIEFDYIDAGIADGYWYAHGESYEHFCCVAKPEGCTGPSEKAPYTHWHPIPQPPQE